MKDFILYKKLRRNACDYGLSITFKKALLYLLKPVYEYRVYRIYGVELDNVNESSFNVKSRTLKIVTEKDIEIIEQIEDMEEWLQGKLIPKLQKGSLCIVCLEGNNVIGFNLVAFREAEIPLMNKKFTLNHTDAWSEQITVHGDFRKKGIATELRYAMFKELKCRGIKLLFGGTLLSNESNLRLSRRVGFTSLLDLHYFKLFNYKRWHYHNIENSIGSNWLLKN